LSGKGWLDEGYRDGTRYHGGYWAGVRESVKDPLEAATVLVQVSHTVLFVKLLFWERFERNEKGSPSFA
jgi:hypothetical protein